MRKRNILIIAILLMAVGFAVVTTNLVINGKTSIGSTAFEVVFTRAIIDGEDISSKAISKSGIELTFSTKELTIVGETSKLEFIVTNMSRQYDGVVTINCPKGSNGEYYTIETEFPEYIKAGSSEYGTLKVTYSKGSPNKFKDEINCSLTFNANEKTNEELDLGEVYQDETLNGADPVLKKAIATYALEETADESKELIPVVISDDGTVKYANIHTRWYSYENKEWANAVILTDEAKEYQVGDTIPEDDIESYFVWVPKYKYQLWNVESTIESTSAAKGAHSIEIIFGTEDTEDDEGVSCKTPMTSSKSENCDNGEYITHPAFISLGVSGIWVGKYETGYKGAQSTTDAEKNNPNSSNIIIKPNVHSWRNIQVVNAFTASYNYNTDLSSHMMKNTEWGAVAILSHSKYGIGKEININNNSSYKTGYSSLPSLDQTVYPGTYGDGVNFNQPYNTEIGYLASSTGNITGIYDMSGGAYEYTASYVRRNFGSTGFNDELVTNSNYVNYLDIYVSSSGQRTYEYRILGDATGEMGPLIFYQDGDGASRYHNWYDAHSTFADSSKPCFYRGGNYDRGALAGQFNFSAQAGNADLNYGFRIVLAV